MRFQFTGLIRGPTIYRQGYYMMWTISIHRPHTRPDADYFSQTPRPKQFQFTGLIRGPTLASKSASSALSIFQFTGLIRGPTNLRLDAAGQPANFNSQASYEARPINQSQLIRQLIISIHRPHTRPDMVVLG